MHHILFKKNIYEGKHGRADAVEEGEKDNAWGVRDGSTTPAGRRGRWTLAAVGGRCIDSSFRCRRCGVNRSWMFAACGVGMGGNDRV